MARKLVVESIDGEVATTPIPVNAIARALPTPTPTPAPTPASASADTDLSKQLKPHQWLGRYEILRHLATGGMAELYLARAHGPVGFEKTLVLKRIRPELAGNAQIVQLFLQEARLSALLIHPNVAQVFDVEIAQGNHFLVMEYVHGQDLAQVLNRAVARGARLPLADGLYIAMGILRGLQHAHEKRGFSGLPLGIVHRDVSPRNILVSYEGTVKVVDFGIALARWSTSAREITQQGGVRGKLSYMSPEQLLGEPLDRRTDLFAAGILLYEITTGTRLYRPKTREEAIVRIVHGPVPKPSAVVAGYPPELERIVTRALAKNREKRYASAEEMELDLEAFVREQRLAVSPISVSRQMGGLFSAEIGAWREAQEGGKDLAQHLVEVTGIIEGPPQMAHSSGSLWQEGEVPATPLLQGKWWGKRWMAPALAVLLAGAALCFIFMRRGPTSPAVPPKSGKTAAVATPVRPAAQPVTPVALPSEAIDPAAPPVVEAPAPIAIPPQAKEAPAFSRHLEKKSTSRKSSSRKESSSRKSTRRERVVDRIAPSPQKPVPVAPAPTPRSLDLDSALPPG